MRKHIRMWWHLARGHNVQIRKYPAIIAGELRRKKHFKCSCGNRWWT